MIEDNPHSRSWSRAVVAKEMGKISLPSQTVDKDCFSKKKKKRQKKTFTRPNAKFQAS
jgi:hypothetical protein